MKRKILTIILLHSLFLIPNVGQAKLCKKSLINDPAMNLVIDESWAKEEEKRIAKEDLLIAQNPEYLSKSIKLLSVEPYRCEIQKNCDSLKNCQLHKDAQNFHEIEYKIKTDAGIIISKSYCSVLGKCVGYNDFLHDQNTTISENRLIDVKKDNAIFYHYFYSAYTKNYQPPFNITNFHTGSELYLEDSPHFSPDERFMIMVKSIPNNLNNPKCPSGFAIQIYELNEYGEYKNIEPDEIDPNNPNQILSTFLSRNPSCGETPHFHSWKNNYEIRLSILPPNQANEGRRVILSYNKKTKKWGCQEDLFPEFQDDEYSKIKAYSPK